MSSTRATETQKKPSLFFIVLDTIVLVSTLCGNGPLPFPLVVLASFGASYLIRYVTNDPQYSILFGLLVFSVYYVFSGIYRLFIYNRHLDPLLAIPGPKGHWIRGVNQIIRGSDV